MVYSLAKYGLLRPDQRIEPYEKTLNGASVGEKKAWAHKVSRDLHSQIAASDRIVITAGESYCRYLIPLLQGAGHEVCRPLKGLSMFFQPARLRELAGQARVLRASHE